MATLTYCKGVPTPLDEMNALGFTEFEMFLTAYAPIFHKAVCETVATLFGSESFNKTKWNTHLQQTYGISKRHANGVISRAKGCVDSAKECRKNHVKQLQGKLKSMKTWLSKAEKRLKSGRKFYAKRRWQQAKAGCKFYLSCDLKTKRTNWQQLRFAIHHKKRRIHQLSQQIEHLKTAKVNVKLNRSECFVVGSSDESFGNQVVQWDGNDITFRVPYCLESKFGKTVSTKLGWFDRSACKSRLSQSGSKSWHFYRKDEKWVAACQFTPLPVKRKSRHSRYGCIGIDLNPSAIGWAYVDTDGNLKYRGQIPLQQGLPHNKQQAQIVDAIMQLVALAQTFECPIVVEKLDFSSKKAQLKERGKKNARMLSGWSYAAFNEMLDSICQNRGITVLRVNAAYSSVIGMVKYARMYGLGSDCAAALVIARRAMRLSERLPSSITAYLSVKDGKHVWSHWSQLNKKLKASGVRRHTFYSNANCGLMVKLCTLQSDSSKPLALSE